MTAGRAIDFFIVGVQKAGTTALGRFLQPHPAIQIAAVKEVHFFDNEAVDWRAPDYTLLNSHFDWDDPRIKVRGEATPIYVYWPNAVERLRRYNEQAKIILCLRHPAFRAYSHWRMETTRAAESLSFEEAISASGRRRVVESPGGVHRVFSYVERGFYAAQLRRLLRVFPREQILFLRTEDLWLETQRTIARVEGFLGLDTALRVEPHYIVPLHSRDLGPIPDQAALRLNQLFASDIAETQRLTGLPLNPWLDPAYAEPMADR